MNILTLITVGSHEQNNIHIEPITVMKNCASTGIQILK